MGDPTAVIELAMRPGRLQRVELLVLVFNAHLEAVLSVDLGEVIRDLEGLADFVRGQEGVASELGEVSNSKGRQAAILLTLLNALNTVLSRDSARGAFRPEPRSVQVREPGTHLIYCRRAEDVGKACDSLVRLCRLQTLLECAAVGYATEDTRNKLRVIRIAEAQEYLILVGRVKISANIEVVRVLINSRAVRVGLDAGIWRRKEVQ